MNISNNFYNWKKNIKRVPLTGYSFSFDTKLTNLEQLKFEFVNLGLTFYYKKLYDLCHQNLLKFSSTKYYDQYYYYEEPDYSIRGKIFELQFTHRTEDNSEYLYGNINFDDEVNKFESILLKMSGIKNIIKFNPHYKVWDNATSPSSYKYNSGLKIYFNNTFQTKMVDISNRPGRMQWKNDFLFHGGSEYWFHKKYFNLDLDLLKVNHINFDTIGDLDNKIIYIKLCENLDYWSEDNQKTLEILRKLLKIDVT